MRLQQLDDLIGTNERLHIKYDEEEEEYAITAGSHHLSVRCEKNQWFIRFYLEPGYSWVKMPFDNIEIRRTMLPFGANTEDIIFRKGFDSFISINMLE